MPVAVPFSGIHQWNGIRARLLSTPGVIGVDVSTIAENGAVIRLAYTQIVQNLAAISVGQWLAPRADERDMGAAAAVMIARGNHDRFHESPQSHHHRAHSARAAHHLADRLRRVLLSPFWSFSWPASSDGVDGFIARRYRLKTQLGAYLDPLADKLLLVSIYLTLGFLKFLPAWLVILVASRDVLIVGAVILSWLLDKPLRDAAADGQQGEYRGADHPGRRAYSPMLGLELQMHAGRWRSGSVAVAVLTVASGALYMREWARHMANGPQREHGHATP